MKAILRDLARDNGSALLIRFLSLRLIPLYNVRIAEWRRLTYDSSFS